MDLVRNILLAIQSSDRQLDSSTIHIAGYTGSILTEHMRLLLEAGLVDGTRAYCIEHKVKWIELRLTWSGHDFVDAARNDLIWVETLNVVRGKNGGVPFEALKMLLIEAAHGSGRGRPEPPMDWSSYMHAAAGQHVLNEQPA